jgi:predicted enzyme related to lactoylglutathione lyase
MLKDTLSSVLEEEMNNRPIHFELQADNLERAMKFYADVFDWKFEDYSQLLNSPYFGVITGEEGTPGINGGIQLRPAARPGLEMGTNAATLTMGVEDYDLFEQKILMAGGQVALPKMALTGMAWQGYYLDTEGNVFGIHQPDESAGLPG